MDLSSLIFDDSFTDPSLQSTIPASSYSAMDLLPLLQMPAFAIPEAVHPPVDPTGGQNVMMQAPLQSAWQPQSQPQPQLQPQLQSYAAEMQGAGLDEHNIILEAIKAAGIQVASVQQAAPDGFTAASMSSQSIFNPQN